MKLIPGIEEVYCNEILSLFGSLPANTKAILFGSRAKGNYREGSDIDIALVGDDVTLDDRDSLLEKYQNLNLPWKLDIVVYSLIAEPALKEHIDRVGKKLY